MESNTGFSTNTLLNAIRSSFEHAKEKFSCDQIQEIMNLITDLEYEIHLLQTNYENVLRQNLQINDIEQNVQEIFQKLATNQLPTISEESDGTTGNANSADNAGQNGDAEQEDEVEAMAEMISDLVVKKLSALEE